MVLSFAHIHIRILRIQRLDPAAGWHHLRPSERRHHHCPGRSLRLREPLRTASSPWEMGGCPGLHSARANMPAARVASGRTPRAHRQGPRHVRGLPARECLRTCAHQDRRVAAYDGLDPRRELHNRGGRPGLLFRGRAGSQGGRGHQHYIPAGHPGVPADQGDASQPTSA